MYFEWLTHTNFSFLAGVSHPGEYIERAAHLGYSGLGICDYDGLYGIVRAFTAHQSLKLHKKLKLFYGSEIHLQQDHHLPIIYQDTLVFYALNMTGYQNLCKILTYAHRENKNHAFIDLSDLLAMDLDHLVCLVPMRGIIRNGCQKTVQSRWQLLKRAMPERLYIVISRHLNQSEDCWITPSLQIAHQLNLPILISQDCFFHHTKNKDLCDLVQAIRHNRQMKDAIPYMFINDERCLKDLHSIHHRYHLIPGYEQAMLNSKHLASLFNFSLKELRYHYPKEMIPKGYTAQSYLEKLVWESAHTHYGHPLPSSVENLIHKELTLIRELEFADYFLTVWDIVRWARQKNILCQGRGSAANSAICYVLGITAVDPTKFDLLFERFMSVTRGDPPDIDVDFEHERREEVIQYVYHHYGRGRAAMVANVITFRSRGAIRCTGKALGIPEKFLSDAASLQKIRSYRRGDASKSLESLEDQSGGHIPFKLWGHLSERLKGYPRHMGIHSGGFILTEHTLNHLVPQEPATMKDRTVVQWSKVDLEALGFFKIDLLSLGMLTALRKALHTINATYQKNIEMKTIPQGDVETYQMIQKANTVGTFQIESRAQMSMLPRLKPKCFYDLVIQVGIIRPGPIQGGLIHPFLRRRKGVEPVTYAHPSLEPILKRTLGVPIFQEQVMRLAMAVGDFTAEEADQLRKQIGSWSMNKDLGPMVKGLEKGMRKNRISERFIQQILKQLEGFASYGFPESHAVSFALISYASSWIKCHYPAAFFMSLLNSQPMGFYSRHALIQAAIRDGVKILPICINHSEWDAILEEVSNTVFGIRLGFNMVRGLTKSGADQLIKERSSQGRWNHIDAFLKTSHLFRGDLTALAAANSLKCLGADRRSALWIAEAAPYASYIEENLQESFPEEGSMVGIERDFDAFGTSLTAHPAEMIKRDHWYYPLHKDHIILSNRLHQMPKNLMVKVFGMVLVRQAPPTAKGMVFFTLEDETGFINLAFQPHTYDKLSDSINGQSFLCVEGRLQQSDENQSHSILVTKIYKHEFSKADIISIKELPEQVKVMTKKTLARSRNYM